MGMVRGNSKDRVKKYVVLLRQVTKMLNRLFNVCVNFLTCKMRLYVPAHLKWLVMRQKAIM